MKPTGAEFTPAQIDRAKRLLGRLQFRSRVVVRLQAHYELDRNAANRLLAAAQAAYRAMCGESGDGDPLVACVLFFQTAMADQGARACDRINAANGLVRLLGLHRAIKRDDGGGGGDAIIEAILKRPQSPQGYAAGLN